MLFSSLGVLTTEELHARQEVEYENYIMKRQIEARIAGDMATNIVLPAAIAYQNMLIENISGLTDVFGKDAKAMTAGQREVLAEVSKCVSQLHASASSLRGERSKINKIDDIAKRAVKYGSVVTPLIEEVGTHCARLEIGDNEIWPLPKFRMLFTAKSIRPAHRSIHHRLFEKWKRRLSRAPFSLLSHLDSPSLIWNAYQPASIRGPLECHLPVFLDRSLCCLRPK